MRWVFIRPRNQSPYYDPEIQEPLGLEALAAWRRRRGDDVLILDAALDRHDDRRLGRRAAAFRPDAVGLALSTAQDLESALAVHAEVLRADPRGTDAVCWVAGGNFVSSEPGHAARLLPGSFSRVRFEGELALDALVDAGTPHRGILIDGAPVRELDELPFPERPFADIILANGWSFNVQGSRGCSGACRYCAAPGMAPAGAQRGWRGRSVRHIVEEIAELHDRHGARCFNFVDEDFLGPPAGAADRAAAFASEVSRRELRASFGVQVRPCTLSPTAIDHLAGAGVSYVFLGLEFDDPGDFRRWGRPIEPDAWAMIAALRLRGIEVNVGTLLFHPHSSLAGVRRFAAKLQDAELLDYRTATNRMDAIPGSRLHAEAGAAGLIDPDTPGAHRVPFEDAEVERFQADLLRVLAPLGPPSMHAVCALPAVAARRATTEDAGPRGAHESLQRIIARTRTAVGSAFFALLDAYAAGTGGAAVPGLRSRCFDDAMDASAALADGGFVASVEELREAIRRDAGM